MPVILVLNIFSGRLSASLRWYKPVDVPNHTPSFVHSITKMLSNAEFVFMSLNPSSNFQALSDLKALNSRLFTENQTTSSLHCLNLKTCLESKSGYPSKKPLFSNLFSLGLNSYKPI